jgi:hypothetical protein
MKQAFNLTFEEFEEIRRSFPINNKKGDTFLSINSKNKIEYLSNRHDGTAGLAYTYPVRINGKKMSVPRQYILKQLFELPDDFRFWVTYDGIMEYAKENNLTQS